jgi:hypothetical protein
MGNVEIIVTKTQISCVFTITFELQKEQKWLTPFWNLHNKLDIYLNFFANL